MHIADQNDQEAFARFEQRSAMGTAAWRLLLPPVSVKRKVTVLVFDQFVGSTLPTLIQAATDNNTSVIAIEARDFSAETAEGRVMALIRMSKQSIIKFKGSLWARERSQACIVFGATGDEVHMRISHQGKLRLYEGLPQGYAAEGIQNAASRLLQFMAANDDAPTCQLHYRFPAL